MRLPTRSALILSVSECRKIENVALIGFMGTGKSSVGRLAAELLQFTFVDTDEMIETSAGKSVFKIFEEDGESVFRKYERRILADLQSLKRTVISTGGGVGGNEANLTSLKQHALVVCLWASPQIIWNRVRTQTHRPLLQTPDPKAKIHELLVQREPFYRQADILVNTEVRSVREVAQHVVHEFHFAIQHR